MSWIFYAYFSILFLHYTLQACVDVHVGVCMYVFYIIHRSRKRVVWYIDDRIEIIKFTQHIPLNLLFTI